MMFTAVAADSAGGVVYFGGDMVIAAVKHAFFA